MISVATFYRFVPLSGYRELRDPVTWLCRRHGVRGTILLAGEGINATIAGERREIEAVIEGLGRFGGLEGLGARFSTSEEMPFKRLKVRLKKEIVTMGVKEIDPTSEAGTYVDPQDWNRLIDDPQVLVIDTRNDYEVEVGTFEGAVSPAMASFREFPDYVDRSLDPLRHTRVAMFCTGGIRCEKATAYLRRRGFGEVYHLRGGILRYLEEMPEAESRWKGECFVFDERVALDHELQPGDHSLCPVCQRVMPESGAECRHCQRSACTS
ncbi:MAG: rhodanese-related sulfurtransferase [Bacteroidota bacterium]